MIPRRRAIAVIAASMTSLSLPMRASAQGTPTSSRGATEAAVKALARINAYRAEAGVSPAEMHPALMISASNHVAYFDRNKDASSALHDEIAGRPGFTGASMADRANAAGYSSMAITENAGFGSLLAAVDWAMSSVSHRLPLIHPSALDMGLAESSVSGFNVIAVGLRRGMSYAVLPSFYPSDGAREVILRWDGGESPDPAPGIPRPLGSPVTVCFGLGQKVEWESVELRGPDDRAVEATLTQKSWMSAVALIPNKPLAASTRYVVKVTARVDGAAVTREAAFQTGRA